MSGKPSAYKIRYCFTDYTNRPEHARNSDVWLLGGQVRLMLIAPQPAATLERTHHGVSSLVKMLRSVAAGRAVAAPHVAASQAYPQLDRTLAESGTLRTRLAARLYATVNRFEVLTVRHAQACPKSNWMSCLRQKIRSKPRPAPAMSRPPVDYNGSFASPWAFVWAEPSPLHSFAGSRRTQQ